MRDEDSTECGSGLASRPEPLLASFPDHTPAALPVGQNEGPLISTRTASFLPRPTTPQSNLTSSTSNNDSRTLVFSSLLSTALPQNASSTDTHPFDPPKNSTHAFNQNALPPAVLDQCRDLIAPLIAQFAQKRKPDLDQSEAKKRCE